MERAFETLENSERPLSTNEVADRLEVDWHTAKKRLEKLVNKEKADRSEVSNRLTLYWDREIPF
ncbi:MAG: hypothetical protein MUP63_00645 [Candidatus Nanohaloarchaeota archaeon QJJ-7]|nr:hypothetical protein [Candidatus Nanohaloarchaeota archaeon QJJ-7]